MWAWGLDQRVTGSVGCCTCVSVCMCVGICLYMQMSNMLLHTYLHVYTSPSAYHSRFYFRTLHMNVCENIMYILYIHKSIYIYMQFLESLEVPMDMDVFTTTGYTQAVRNSSTPDRLSSRAARCR